MWARVSNNAVVMVVEMLPKTFQGVSNFDALTNVELATYGWLPYSKQIPTFDRDTEYVKSQGYTITATDVVEVFDKFPKLNLTQPTNTKVSKLQFRSRFTLNELAAIEVARDTGTVQVKAALNVLKDNLMAASDIDLADARTIQGIQMLVSFGLLTSQRATEILTV